MNFPPELKYTKDHEWVKIDGDIAVVGITEFAQGELGDIVYVDVNTVGEVIAQYDVFGTVEAVKTVSDLFMPLSGEILELNPQIDASPELVNTDPYGGGWMIRIRITKPEEIAGLQSAEEYKALIGA